MLEWEHRLAFGEDDAISCFHAGISISTVLYDYKHMQVPTICTLSFPLAFLLLAQGQNDQRCYCDSHRQKKETNDMIFSLSLFRSVGSLGQEKEKH